ncbi:MAG: methyltransferase domain-containing protein [Bacteroidales bacterium]|jgi:SAM-dependent methyltransferase|nr:methyltransferase domain-containing protein [Bacteroidales bacterium]
MMKNQLTSQDRKRIEEGIRGKYTKVSDSPEGLFQYPTGRAGLEALNYDSELIQALPDSAVASYCGVGNPFTLGVIRKGEAVLDIGCGAGIDTIVAAMMVGPAGTVVGIDMVPEMLARARENLRMTDLKNVIFEEAYGEKLPFADGGFDVVISNGVFNLIPDKAKALSEVVRVLKPGGRLMMADQILVGELPSAIKARVASWAK